MNPWLRPLPWYKKLFRVLHCTFSMMSHVVFLDYLIADLDYLMEV